MKKDRLINIATTIVVAVIASSIVVYASNNLFASNIVSYDNTTSHVRSGNVQGAIDELYACASDYSSINARVTSVEDYKNQIYPVGSIYISVSSTNPSTLFGGTWEAFGTGKTLIGVNTNDTDFDMVEESHGSKTVNLQTTNLPAHTHTYAKANSNTGSTVLTTNQIPSHRHDIPSLSGSTGISNAYNTDKIYQTGGSTNLVALSWGGSYVGLDSSFQKRTEHTHSVTTNASKTGYFGESKGHTHSISTTSTNTDSTGNGTAFSVMNPYITVYMWKRTA